MFLRSCQHYYVFNVYKTIPWEQRKVADTYKVTRGYVLAAPLTRPTADLVYLYPVYSSQTLNEGLMGYYDKYLFDSAITWTTDGANAGTVRYRKGRFYCTNVCGVLLSDEGFANKANAEALNNIAWKYVSKVGNPKLMNNVMADIEFYMSPSLTEQQKISSLLEQLDIVITLHQREHSFFSKAQIKSASPNPHPCSQVPE